MREPKQIAIDIVNGDKRARQELEKMFGKKFENMTIKERRLGTACLSALEKIWNR